MLIKRIYLFPALLALFLFPSCEKESAIVSSRVVIGIASDVESLNPVYSYNVTAGSICELLYLSLVQHNWDETSGELTSEPMLAKAWQWSEDSSSILIDIRDDVYWSDSIRVTSEDVVFSFDIYSDPDVQSWLYGTFSSFYTNKNLSIDLRKTFEVLSPFKLKINFLPGSVPSLFKIDYVILPKHIYEKTNRKNYLVESAAVTPVTNGAFSLSRWDKSQAIILKANKRSFLYKPGTVSELVFKIVPDYTARLSQLKQGEIDLSEDIRPEDINELKKNGNIAVVPVKGREYEFIGWNNIEPSVFVKSQKSVSNKLFGSPSVRKALTMAINRQEILEDYLYNNGMISNGPIAPIFKNAFNNSILPLEYNPEASKEILKNEGWTDNDNDGILEKGNIEFKFTLNIPAGNPRRNYTATLIKNNLKAIGIDVTISTLEFSIFLEEAFARKFDALLASWTVPIPIELRNYWYSDIETTQLNPVSYQSKDADRLINELDQKITPSRKNDIYKEFQDIIFSDQPVSFLYWIDNITAHNKKIKGMDITPLGIIHHCWEWRVD